MKITTEIKLNLKTSEVIAATHKAIKAGLTDVITDIAGDAIKGSPILTGNNARSIKFEVGPGGEVAKNENEAAVYSTSGYGGFLETGTVRRPATPYFKPALDRNIKKLPERIKAHLT